MSDEDKTPLSEEKASVLLEDLISAFQKAKPNVTEILVVLSNLTYTLGASIGGYTDKGPGDIQELERMYYEHPEKVELALMLQGLLMSTWAESRFKQLVKFIDSKSE